MKPPSWQPREGHDVDLNASLTTIIFITLVVLALKGLGLLQ
jgi:hypothetical protein